MNIDELTLRIVDLTRDGTLVWHKNGGRAFICRMHTGDDLVFVPDSGGDGDRPRLMYGTGHVIVPRIAAGYLRGVIEHQMRRPYESNGKIGRETIVAVSHALDMKEDR